MITANSLRSVLPVLVAGALAVALSPSLRASGPPPCMAVPESLPSFLNVYYVSPPSGDHAYVVGNLGTGNLALLAQVPLPEYEQQEFCGSVLVGPGVSAHVYVPTAQEREGVYQDEIIDPQSGTPFASNTIPTGRLVDTWAWRVASAQTIKPNMYVEIISALSQKVLDVTGGSTEDSATIQQYSYLGGANQHWRLIPVDVNYSCNYPLDQMYFKIQNVESDKVLDVTDEATDDGVTIQQYEWVGTDNQKWQLVPVDAIHYKIVNKNSGKVLDVRGVSTENTATIQQWEYYGGENQKWVINPIIYTQFTNVLSSKVLDVEGASTDYGALLQQWDSWGGDNQKFLMVPVDGEYFKIENVLSHKVVDVRDFSLDNGGAVQQWDYLGSDNQKWKLAPASTGVQIINKLSGKVLDVSGISTENGAKVQQWEYWGNGNQEWNVSTTVVGDPEP